MAFAQLKLKDLWMESDISLKWNQMKTGKCFVHIYISLLFVDDQNASILGDIQ